MSGDRQISILNNIIMQYWLQTVPQISVRFSLVEQSIERSTCTRFTAVFTLTYCITVVLSQQIIIKIDQNIVAPWQNRWYIVVLIVSRDKLRYCIVVAPEVHVHTRASPVPNLRSIS